MRDIARRLALRLGVIGLMNVQFALKDGRIYVLEVNPRASRTVPFIAKAVGVPLVAIASRVMAGETLEGIGFTAEPPVPGVFVKAPVFPFRRFPGVDPVLCHSDLHTLNLIDRGGSLILLDWEYAHASDPVWDLAGWGANNDFEDPIRHELLGSYLGRPPSGGECLRLQLLSWLYDYVCLLWSELYLNLQRAARADVAVQGDAAMDGVSARARELAARLDSSGAAIDASK